MYTAENGKIAERFPFHFSACSFGLIESVSFYHVMPGSRCMLLGTAGCNFRCSYCSNAHIACQNPESIRDEFTEISPDELLNHAAKFNCASIIFNTNEPAVSLPTLTTLKKHCDKSGLPLGCLTNAYTTEESTEQMAQIFDFINIGLKGFSDQFYSKYTGALHVAPVLRNIRRLAELCHIEITTPAVEGVNDSELDEIADFIASVDAEIPWHVYRLLPEHEMKQLPYPDIEALSNRLNTARKKLRYVYLHNFVGSDWVNTLCPHCSSEIITRISLGCGGDRLSRYLVRNGCCPQCGSHIRICNPSSGGANGNSNN